ARKPSATRFELRSVPTISPRARMSDVVSVMITKITTVIEMIGPISNAGAPNGIAGGRLAIPPSPTPEKSVAPHGMPTMVPITMPTRIDNREIAPWNTLLITKMINNVSPARPMLLNEPNDSAVSSPPMAQSNAVGISDNPITVMIVPVTTGGKKRMSFAKKDDTIKPITPATSTDPSTGWMPPSLPTEASLDTLANEIPCTNGRRAPNGPSPNASRIVASPLMNSPAVISSPISEPDSPAASPIINGGAITPP